MKRLSLLLLSGVLCAPTGAATISVNSTADIAANDGLCTLREAIQAANTDMPSGDNVGGDQTPLPGECPAGDGADSIVFAIPGSGPHTIMPLGNLPPITTTVQINGYSQPGAKPNTINALSGFNADIRIVIDGSLATTATAPGLVLQGAAASGSSVRGLAVANVRQPACCADAGISVLGNISNVTIAGNVVSNAQLRGVLVLGTTPHAEAIIIGGPEAADRNVLHSQFNGAGLALSQCTDCRVENNWFGIASVAGAPVAAANPRGMSVDTTTRLVIADNWFGRNSDGGLVMNGANIGTRVHHNLFGGSLQNGSGVSLFNLGSAAPRDIVFEGNVITGNTGSGIRFANSVVGNAAGAVVLRGNRVYGNGGLEFDLGSNGGNAGSLGTVNPNDPGDGDSGPNSLQNYPVLGMPAQVGAALQLPYTLDSPAGSYEIEFSFATQCDGTGHGLQGSMPRDPLVIETTQLSGTAMLQPVAAPAAGFVVATATGSEGTSEFSACMPYAYSVSPTVFANGFE